MKCCLTAFLFSKISVSGLRMYFSCLDLKRDISGELNRNQIKPWHLCLKKSLGKIMLSLNPVLLGAGFVDIRLMCFRFFLSFPKRPDSEILFCLLKNHKNFKVEKIILPVFLSCLMSGLKEMS